MVLVAGGNPWEGMVSQDSVTRTDPSRWRLWVERGRHVWKYLRSEQEVEKWPQSFIDRYWLGLETKAPTFKKATKPFEAAQQGFAFLRLLQADDGHWPAEYGGPMFLLPGLVIGLYVTKVPVPEEWSIEITRYLVNRASIIDGGWGMHIEGHSTVFGTALNYIALRLLGMKAEHPVAQRARACLHEMGGAIAAPSWGKFWMSVLNVYGWEGNHSIPPEVILLPEWTPIHPSRWWVHTRAVFWPMSYLYAKRFQAPEDALILQLREELYLEPYEAIQWSSARDEVSDFDRYLAHSKTLTLLQAVTAAYERTQFAAPALRAKAIRRAYELIKMEDENTSYQCIGPVNKMMNMVACFVEEGPASQAFALHRAKVRDFLWMAKDGMRMTGTNGSQLWDLSFVTQSAVETGLAEEGDGRKVLLGALKWLEDQQIQENSLHHGHDYRQSCKGAWPFSTAEQNYLVSDCASEGLKAVLLAQDLQGIPQLVSDERIYDTINVLLTMQNADGGFASYETIRGPKMLEYINPAEVFGEIMIEYTYPECTTSVLTALSHFRKRYPDYRQTDIQRVMEGCIRYIHSAQREDGSWFGCWAICFTYATMFALESLSTVGEIYASSDSAKRGCDFLIKKQNSDGGWGESYKSCELGRWVAHPKGSQVVNTAWAMLALIRAQYPDREPLAKAARLIMSRQLPTGEWAQEGIEGVFNRNCMISYPLYKLYFTTWALGLFAKKYGDNV